MSSTVSRAAPLQLERLMALSIAVLAWFVCAGLLAMGALVPPAGEMIETGRLPFQPSHLLIPLFAAVLWQSSSAVLPAGSRLRHTAAFWAAWTVVGVAGVLIPDRSVRAPWSNFDLVMQQAGLVIGIACGWLCTPTFARRLEHWLTRCDGITRAGIIVISAAVLLVPIAPDTNVLGALNGRHIESARGYLKALQEQLYLALKPLILWVPVGLLYAFAQKQTPLTRWTMAGALAFLLVGLPLLHSTLSVQGLLEIVSAFWGIGVGVWLGRQVGGTSRSSETLHRDAPAILSEANRSAGEAGAGEAARRIVAVLILLGVSVWAWFFPRWGALVLVGLGFYALLLWRYPNAWLLVMPAALPLLNLAPGTGRFFFDEFDMLMATTVAMALWHGPKPTRSAFARPLGFALALFGLSIVISVVIGLLPLSPLDANAFTNYLSHYSSMRVAKGFLWAIPLIVLMRWMEPDCVMRLFVPGMWLGLAGVIAVGVAERASFASLVNLTVPYRITATFSTMHTGGSEIETYLVTAIPFVWLAFSKEWPAAVRLAGLILLALGSYVMTLTIARGGVLALGVALAVLLLSAWRTALPEAKSKSRTAIAAIAFLGGAIVLAVGLSGGYLQKRLANAGEDWSTRVSHWRLALAMRDRGFGTTVFGMGLGRFPEAYLLRSGAASLPGTYGFIDEDGNRFLRLGGGETLYMAQRVPVTDGRHYTLSIRVRSRNANAQLGVPLCEKHLLDSFRCHWHIFAVPGDGTWHPQSIPIDTGLVGGGNWITRRPVELSLYNDTVGTLIDVDDVQLLDDEGNQLIRNGDFSAASDYWFFKTHSHLPWHIKNLWAEVLFEQGWFGLITFVLLLAALLTHLARATWRGDRLAGVLLASTSGFLTVGLFGSLFDAPRIAELFWSLVVVAAAAVGRSANRVHDTASGMDPPR